MCALLCFGFSWLQAQENETMKPARQTQIDSLSRAQYQTNAMVEKLSLTDMQRTKVSEINMRYENQHKMMLDSMRANGKTPMRDKMTTMRKAQDAELKSVLTSDQWNTWEKWQAEERTKRGDHKEWKNDHAPMQNQTPSEPKQKSDKMKQSTQPSQTTPAGGGGQ